jgi:hypothetical protein
VIGTDEDLQAAARVVFQDVASRTAGRALCYPVARAASDWARKFAEPMRVAVAGEIKRGKSTLVNALVAADAALTAPDGAQDRALATGQLETTYVLTELVHGTPAGICVRYRDGTTVTAALGELRTFTVRRDHRADRTLEAVDRVVVTTDAPMLRRFRLIDTPGFNSVYGADAAASLELLTARGIDGAGAVIYTIGNEGLSSISRDVARQFVSSGTVMTPLKAIGVMPRANELWSALLMEKARTGGDLDTDPLRRARREIDAMPPGGGREMFHAIIPVAALLGEAAALATDDDFAALQEFGQLEPAGLAASFTAGSAGRRFASRPDFPLDTATRQRLVTTFSPWGLFTAVQALRDRPSIPELRRLLDERSGVAGLRELVCNHFGERAGTVRVRDALGEVTVLNRRLRLRLPEGGDDHATLQGAGRELEGFERAHAVMFWQIDVLGQFYRRELSLAPGQVGDLLRLTGERGGGLAARLGLPAEASPGELRQAAVSASRRWAAAAWAGPNRSAAEKMVRICDAIQHQARTQAATR